MVDTTTIVGIILITGFLMGELATYVRLPKVTGYILAGVLLNPQVTPIIPKNIGQHTNFVTNIALSFITFSIGGTLLWSEIKRLGKGIAAITILEAEVTFLVIAAGLIVILPWLVSDPRATMVATFIPVGLLVGALGSPTDPSGTLAVVHQYRAKGDVTSTILSVSAFDDALGLVNFSIAFAVAAMLVQHQGFSLYASIGQPALQVFGALAIGTGFGFLFNFISHVIRDETEGVFIVMLFGLLSLCFGVSRWLNCDELLGTMMMGMIVTNFNKRRERVFEILERYAEEIIFVLFFTLSGMFLDFNVLWESLGLVGLYVVLRTIGKFSGTGLGAWIAHASAPVKRYTGFGLIPSGGIIVGLALLLKQEPGFTAFADIIISVIIGSTVILEIAGPLAVRFALRRVGEVGRS